MERVFAALPASRAEKYSAEVEEAVKNKGLRVLAKDSVSGEELSEVGLDLGSFGYGDTDTRELYVIWLLEGDGDAFKSLSELSSNRLSHVGIVTAPSASAAAMIIGLLFPSLDDEPSGIPSTPSAVNATTRLDDKTPTSKPFPLSNLALIAEASPADSPTSSRNLSPKIAQALEQLETRSATSKSDSPIQGRRVFEEKKEGEEVADRNELENGRADTNSALTSEPPRPTSASSGHRGRQSRARSSTALSMSGSSTTSVSSATSFKARPAPPPPTAQPRMTKAAALRLGIPLPPPTPRRKTASSVDTVSVTPRAIETPRSLAAPSITPRLSKTAAMRSGQPLPSGQASRTTKRQSISTSERAALDRLTRRQSVQLPSAAPVDPLLAEVRMSKAAILRMGVASPPLVDHGSKRSRQSTSTSLDEGIDPVSKQPDRRMSVSTSLKSLREPAIAPRSTKASSLRTGSSVATPTVARGRSIAILDDNAAGVEQVLDNSVHQRRASVQVASTRPPAVEVRMSRAALLRSGQTVAPASNTTTSRTSVSDVDYRGVPGHKRRESITVPSMHNPPTHTPRPNRASLLRQKSDSTTTTLSSSSISVARRPSSALPSTGSLTPRLNRAAELRQKALEAKEQLPVTPNRGGGGGGGQVAKLRESSVTSKHGGRTSSTDQKTPRPASAMSDLSNGSRV